jgi:L-ribulose-5-phosphate 4-epimerase
MPANDIRNEVLKTALALYERDLIQLTSGNVSARVDANTVAITPTSLSYEQLQPEDIVLVDLEGHVVEGEHLPSSELPMHLAVYQAMPEVQAVTHTHSIYALAFAVAGKSIPVVSLEGLGVGGAIPVARYACPGTRAQGEVAVEALQGPPRLSGCLLQNHGLLATGKSLSQAYATAYKMELAAQVYYMACQIGAPRLLSPVEIDEIMAVYQANTRKPDPVS